MRLDLIDCFYLSLYPYVAGEGRRLFDDVSRHGPLDVAKFALDDSQAQLTVVC
jgi:hypothetical protein